MAKWLLVGGCPRSGTTLLNLVLNSHPGISITAEHNLEYLLRRIDELFVRESRLPTVPVREKSSRENWDHNTVYTATLRRRDNTAKILEYVYDLSFGNSNTANEMVYGDKVPRFYDLDLDYLAQTLSDLTVIQVHRNPIDVANSMLRRARNTRANKDYWRGPASIDDICAEWARAWNFSVVNSNRTDLPYHYVELKYEALIDNAESELANLATAIGVEPRFDVSMISNATDDIRNSITQNEMSKVQERVRISDSDWGERWDDLKKTVGAIPESLKPDMLTRLSRRLGIRR